VSGSDQPPAGHSRAELRKATLAGIRWITLSRVVAELFTLTASVALARLIVPAEFGRGAVALIVAAIAGVVMSQGIGAALVQMRSAERSDLQSATLLALLMGVVLTAVTFVVGRYAVPPVLGDRIGALIELSSLTFLLAAPGAVSQARLQRELQFRRVAAVQVAPMVCGTIASVVLAATIDANAEALVAGALVSAGLGSIMAMAYVPFTAPRWHRAAAARIASFGIHSGLATLAYTVFRQVDYVILAGRMSAGDVGLYWRAYQLGVEYQTKITTVMLRVTFPIFSRTASRKDMRAIRTRVVRLHAALVVPPLATFIAIAPVFIPFLYGSAWEGAVVPAQLLAIVGMGAAIVTGIGPLMLAAGKPRELMIYNLVTLAVYALAVYVMAPHGLTAVCLGVLAVQTVNFGATHYFLLQRMLGIPVSGLWAEVAPGACAGAALLAVTYPLVDRLSAAGVGDVLVLLAAVPVAAAIAVTVIWRLFPAAWADAMLIVGAVRPGRKPAPAS